MIFDETYFGLFATKYLSHRYYFNIHPPLGKMLLAVPAFFRNVKPGFDFVSGVSYGDFNFLPLRFLPAFLGSVLPLLIYLLVKELGFSKRVAFLSGFMVLLDNAILVQSRFILMDIILVFFIFLSLYLFLLSRRFPVFSYKWHLSNVFLAISLGAAISIKWTGFGILGIIWFLIVFQDRLFFTFKKEIIVKIGLLFILPLLLYFLVFAMHFYLLPLSCSKDCGAVLGDDFRERVRGLSHYENNSIEQGLFVKFVETNKAMFISNFDTETSYPYQSSWYSWPFMARPIKYFEESYGDTTSFIYFFGNPFVWWLGIIGVVGYFYLIIKNYFYNFKLKLPQTFYSKNIFILLLGYFVYTSSFVMVERFTLLYHYLPALIFSIILLSVFFEGILDMYFRRSGKGVLCMYIGVLTLILVGFVYFAPLTYGLPISTEKYNQMMWFDSWR